MICEICKKYEKVFKPGSVVSSDSVNSFINEIGMRDGGVPEHFQVCSATVESSPIRFIMAFQSAVLAVERLAEINILEEDEELPEKMKEVANVMMQISSTTWAEGSVHSLN